MGDTPSLGPAPERTVVGSDQVRRLVEDQFPQWADLKVEPVGNGGWDNWTFHLGSDKVVRLPSAAKYAHAVEKEHRWLPVLAPGFHSPSRSLSPRGRLARTSARDSKLVPRRHPAHVRRRHPSCVAPIRATH
jgi:hypothetical protein